MNSSPKIDRAYSERPLLFPKLARLRGKIYQLFAGIVLYPDEGELRTLIRAARDLTLKEHLLRRFAFFTPWRRVLCQLQGLDSSDLGRLQAEYIESFALTSAGELCLPYESSYVGEDSRAWVIGDVSREYRAAGFSLLPGFEGSPDHAAVELGFMGLLCEKEEASWRQRDVQRTLGLIKQEIRFLERHPCRWFGIFSEGVAEKETHGFYPVVTKAAWAFLQHDVDLLASLTSRFASEEKTNGPSGRR